MADAISLAAKLVRAAPQNCGDPMPTWKELDAIGDLMREAAVFIRQAYDREKQRIEPYRGSEPGRSND